MKTANFSVDPSLAGILGENYTSSERVKGKSPLIGRNIVRIGSKEFVITSDKDNLI